MSKSHANISQADMYQMYAYGKEFDSPITVLIYPQFGSLPLQIANYQHNPYSDVGASKRIILVRTVDVSSPISSLNVQQALRRNLLECIYYNNEV